MFMVARRGRDAHGSIAVRSFRIQSRMEPVTSVLLGPPERKFRYRPNFLSGATAIILGIDIGCTPCNPQYVGDTVALGRNSCHS